VPDFGRVFLMLKYTDITQNTYTLIILRYNFSFDFLETNTFKGKIC
jgi:hypothetical protein